jgi:hypothetical protein
VAGVHFPVDSVAGALTGLTLAQYVYTQSCGGAWWSARFDGTRFDPQSDFDWHELYAAAGDAQKTEAHSSLGQWMEGQSHGSDSGPRTKVLAWLWSKAAAEWRDLTPEQL